jgi:hypothetical protein
MPVSAYAARKTSKKGHNSQYRVKRNWPSRAYLTKTLRVPVQTRARTSESTMTTGMRDGLEK